MSGLGDFSAKTTVVNVNMNKQAAKLVDKLLEEEPKSAGGRPPVVTLDFDDPEEREMTIWVDDPNLETARVKAGEVECPELRQHDVSDRDAIEVGFEEVDGGTSFYYRFD